MYHPQLNYRARPAPRHHRRPRPPRPRPSNVVVRLQPVLRPRRQALWLDEVDQLEPNARAVEPLVGTHTTDICIVGGGYTGLWTALRIKALAPETAVTLLEADICGSGASGRNGGMV